MSKFFCFSLFTVHIILLFQKFKKVQHTRFEVAGVANEIIACETNGKIPSEKDKLCKFWWQVAVDATTKRWWLMSVSVIEHNFHPTIHPESWLDQIWLRPKGFHAVIIWSQNKAFFNFRINVQNYQKRIWFHRYN